MHEAEATIDKRVRESALCVLKSTRCLLASTPPDLESAQRDVFNSRSHSVEVGPHKLRADPLEERREGANKVH